MEWLCKPVRIPAAQQSCAAVLPSHEQHIGVALLCFSVFRSLGRVSPSTSSAPQLAIIWPRHLYGWPLQSFL